MSFIFALPFLLKWNSIGVGDWELFVTMAAIPQKTIFYFGQFPFWNPYLGGGNILFAHPEVGILSPFFILITIFGPIVGIKLQMMIAYFLGFYGTYLFARKIGISNISSYLVALVYFGSSYFALHFSIGHVPFTHFCFLPWFIYCILKIEENWKYIFGASVSIALIILGNGAAVPFLYTVFFAGLFLLLYSIEKKQYHFLKNYIFSIIIGLFLASVKFIPMFIYLIQNKWEGMAADATPPGFLFDAFFSFNQAIFKTMKTAEHWGWHEYSAYISPLVVILAVIALIYSFKKTRIYLILTLFFFILGLGHFSSISLWGIVTGLPGFSSLRSPARAFQFVILSVGIISAFGLDYILYKCSSIIKNIKLYAFIFIAIIIMSYFWINLPAFKSIDYKTPASVRFSTEFHNIVGDKFNIYNAFQKNEGSLTAPWLSAYKESRGIVTPNNQVMMEYPIQGQLRVKSRHYTPNRVDYEIIPSSPGELLLGIGYDEGWSADDGRLLYESNGLIALHFNQNDRLITLRYRTPYFYLGLIISLLTLAVILLVYFNPNFGKRCQSIFK
ncbi:MAG: hypothetical protein ABIJ45_06400 [Candidatus Zixiibacteriota bacterium]